MDDKLRMCLSMANLTTCKKMGWGAILWNRVTDTMVAGPCSNDQLNPIKGVCSEECARLSIPSRTESMLGACAHAEEQVIWRAVRKGCTDLDQCEIFVAGVTMDGKQIVHSTPDFTCLRCATLMYQAGILGVNFRVDYGDKGKGWCFVPPELALKTSYEFAIQVRKIAND